MAGGARLMPRANPLQAALNAGELSPRLHARVDFSKYPAGAAVMQNIIPFAQGGWLRRPGTRFIAEARASSGNTTKLLPFEFSTEQAYVIEVGGFSTPGGYFRFFKNQGQIVVANTDAAITNGTFNAGITGWTDSSTGTAALAYDSVNARLDLAGAAGGIAIADQQVTNTTSGEHVIKFAIHGAPGDTLTLSIGTSLGGTQLLAETVFAVGFHTQAFTATGVDFHIRVQNSLAKTVQLDNISLIDDGPLELDTPYTTLSYDFLKTAQTADVMYVANGIDAIYKLSRRGHTSWSLTWVRWNDGPYLDENATGTTLTPAATSGFGITVTASSVAGINGGIGFNGADIGRPLRIQHAASADSGWGIITAVASPTSASVDIHQVFNNTTAVTTWRLGAWSKQTGYPAALSFFEQRFVAAGTNTKPQTFWMSQSANVEDMRPDSFVAGAVAIEDDDGLDYTIAADQVNAILWLSAGTRLVIGTSGAEWIASASGAVVTPTDIEVKRHTAHGSADVTPVRVGESVLFLQRAKRKLLEFAFVLDADGFRGADMTRLAEHISRGGIVQIAHQQEPDSLVWCVRGDGVLACMTFKREEDVVGWSRQILGGGFGSGQAVVESVAVIPGTDDLGQVQDSTNRDEIWVIVKRTIGGQTKRYVEMFEGLFEGPLRLDYGSDAAWETAMLSAQKHSYFADSLLTYDGAATATIAGLDHLEGETVKVLADGTEHADRTVASGQITLAAPAGVVQAGLGYTHLFETLKLTAGAAAGTAVGKTKRVHRVTLVTLDAAGAKIGPDLMDLQTVVLGDGTVPQPLFSGEHGINFGGPWSADPRLVITSDAPLPFTLLALAPELQTNDLR